jgi:hypothetical protein
MNIVTAARFPSCEFRSRLFLVLVMLGALSCSGESSSPVEPEEKGKPGLGPNQGQFIDAPVEGLQFISGVQSGTTDARGVFSFQSGHDVQFWVGNIELGSVAPAVKLSPLHLAQTTDVTDPVATNIARFLQTIDNDGNASNGIKITGAVLVAAVGKSLNFAQTVVEFENDPNVQSVVASLTGVTQVGVRELVDATLAQSQLANGIRSALVGQYSGSFCKVTDGVAQPGGQWAMTVATDGKAKFEFVGVVSFKVSCAMALDGRVSANDPDAGVEVYGSFGQDFHGYWSYHGMTGTYSQKSGCGATSTPCDN